MKLPANFFPMTGGKKFSFKDYQGKYVILYFYPKDFTLGCTLEGREFSQFKKDFEKLNAVVLGVSRDSLESHEKFKQKECYSIDLISDEDQKLCEAFDVIKEKNMYGKKVLGIERSTFILDPQQKVIQEWRKVKAEGHAQEVLNWLKKYI